MNQISSKIDRKNSNDDNIESDRLSPPIKRHCQTSNSKLCLPNQSSSSSCDFIDLTPDNNGECKSCGKPEILLRTFNCPSSHYFCLNCIFNWTQKHVQTKTPPICLVIDCGYSLKIEDLNDLPIPIKDHQILLQLIELKINDNSNNNNQINNLRIKCDKCYLYIDQENFFIHHNECLGRSLTIPCEICYCPILFSEYEQHMLLCNNDDNSALIQFLFKHLQNPNIDEKMIKIFICTWQRKHREAIDIYEIIEEFNQTNTLSNETCDICKHTTQSDEFYFVKCNDNHSSCLLCYRQHVQNSMNNNQILTCHQCGYHLQDKDLSEIRVFTQEQIILYQNYQNKKVIELYSELYGSEDSPNTNSSIPQQQQQQHGTTITNNDNISGCKCELCLKPQLYGNIFVLNCNCKICYDCFANEVNRQRTITDELLICTICRTPIKHNDLSNLRLSLPEVQSIQLYQQGKLFESEHAIHLNRQKSNQLTSNNDNNNNDDDDDDDDLDILLLNQQQCLPKYWTLPMLTNFSRHVLDVQSTEYKFVSDKFYQSWANVRNQYPVPFPAPAPAPLPPPIQVRPPPSGLIPPSTIPPPSSYHTGLFQPLAPIQVPLNNNNGSIINQSQQPPPTHGYGTLPHAIPFRMNTIVPLPPSTQLSAPPLAHSSFVQQQMYPPNIPYVPQNAPFALPRRNPTASSRRARMVNPDNGQPKIIQIERVQNQRWYKQYAAHECEFRQKLGKQSEQWLFHGCDERSSKNIEVECFNRSYAGQHAVAFGQGCYFARDSVYSHSYASPDRNGIRRMFLSRVLVGNTTVGNSTMRVAPPGFDTTSDGQQSIFVTYHDSQAYAEYLINYR